MSLYLCDNKFHTEALTALLADDNRFGFIVMDGNGALFGTLQVCWTLMPGPRILPFCHSEWGAVSDLGGSFHTLIFRCFVLIPSLCLLSASFFPLC